ncbi:MAG: hypothetical protein L5655_02210 [Thermosediminibacteraceae bacterium]|nr:hypothetical protein [Thermosediminibacteraceae bacterium]
MAVAIAIIGMVFTSLGALFARSLYTTKLSAEITTATILAQEKMEELKNKPFESLYRNDFWEESVELNDMKFTRYILIQKVDDNLVKIVVEVKSKNNAVRLVTLRGDF